MSSLSPARFILIGIVGGAALTALSLVIRQTVPLEGGFTQAGWPFAYAIETFSGTSIEWVSGLVDWLFWSVVIAGLFLAVTKVGRRHG